MTYIERIMLAGLIAAITVCLILFVGHPPKPHQVSVEHLVAAKFATEDHSFMYGPGAGSDLETGTCNIFIGKNAGKGIRTASFMVIVNDDFDAATDLVIMIDLVQNQLSVISNGNGRCFATYQDAFYRVEALAKRRQSQSAPVIHVRKRHTRTIGYLGAAKYDDCIGNGTCGNSIVHGEPSTTGVQKEDEFRLVPCGGPITGWCEMSGAQPTPQKEELCRLVHPACAAGCVRVWDCGEDESK